MEDMMEAFGHHLANRPFQLKDLKNIMILYARYYFDHPAVFELFFFRKTNGVPDGFQNLMVNLLAEILTDLAQAGIINYADVPVLCEVIGSATNGMLLLYFSGKSTVTQDEIMRSVEKTVSFLVPSM
jgi:hypothetical protein